MHRNNFDFLRLLFAILVIVHHSYPISGFSEQDALYTWSNAKLTFSYIGVRGFFIISGFLIFQSLMRSKNLTDYFLKRILRIFPALIIVLALSVFFGAFFTILPFWEYMTSIKTWTYLPVNLTLLKMQYDLPGVFASNPIHAVNGSLWTIVFEFSLYVFVTLFFVLRKKSVQFQRFILAIFFVLFVGLHMQIGDTIAQIKISFLDASRFCLFGALFCAGAFISTFEMTKIKYKNNILILAIILFLILLKTAFFEYAQFVLLPIIVLLFGTNSTKYINSIGSSIGDLSYGTYIYGFPIQQALFYYFGWSYSQITLAAIPLSLLFAYFSWHYIEKTSLAAKKSVYEKVAAFLNLKTNN